MKLKSKLNRMELSAVTLCFSASLGILIFGSASSPFIGVMLATIVCGVYVMIIFGKWELKTHKKYLNIDC